MPALAADFRQAFRRLRRNPGFTATAVLTIALGIGGTTAIFSVVNGVLLRPLPYADADRLVLVEGDMVARNVLDFPQPPGDLPDLREQGTSFEAVEAVSISGRSPLSEDGNEAEQVSVAAITPGLLALLGARVVTGREFTEADAAPIQPPTGLPAGATPPPPPPNAALLSYGFWQRRYGGDPGVVGRIVQLGGGSTEIVGVLDPGFELLLRPDLRVDPRPDFIQALRIDLASASRINVFLRFIGRLRPGVSVPQAQAQVDGIVNELRRRFPIKESAGLRWRVEPMHAYLIAEVRTPILTLMGAVAFVLLIACANVANLLMVRAGQRERELVVRAAMGARRADLVRPTMSESLLLAGGGALLGTGLAFAALVALRRAAPANLPRIEQVGIDAWVLGFTALAALVASILFGLVPALRAARPDAGAALRSSSRTTGLAEGRRLRNAVVIAEVALSFVLLVGSGLMVRSFIALAQVDPGFDPDGLLTFQVQANGTLGLRTPDQRAAFERRLRERLEALPGVQAVTAVNPLPLDGTIANARWGTEAAANDPDLFQQANIHIVLPGYFDVMRTRLLDGRTFTEADDDPQQSGIIIDRILAEKAFPDRSAVGQRLFVRIRSNDPEWLSIIGVVDHQRHASLGTEGPETIFVTDGFFGHGASSNWVVRTAGVPGPLGARVRALVAELAPGVPVARLQPMSALVERAMAPTRFALSLIGAFAAIAAALAAIGLYGVLATAVRQRRAEIGIRMTFGASRAGIIRMIVRHGLALSTIGIAIGLAGAFALTRVMQTLLIGVTPTDPATFTAIALFFLAIALLACWLPALRAGGLDPVVVLREE